MTHLSRHEWGRVDVGERGFTRGQADALLAAARAHPLGGREGTDILADHHRHLATRQVVGVLAAGGASLEILPKVDPDSADERAATVRARLVHMLDIALGLDISAGAAASLARQGETLLDILIRLFADQLLGEVRRGLPRQYVAQEDDLAALRGRLDVVRQFTAHAVRPDRLACRFDSLEADTPMLRVMKACVVALSRCTRVVETQRQLGELRFVLADVPDVPPSRLPWDRVRIDRTNRRWRSLFELAKLFLRRDWQATHHAPDAAQGVTLLFAMNDLFEVYIAARLRAALANTGVEISAQGGLEYCLGEWREGDACRADVFQTRPDIILRRSGRVIAIIDTKWKKLGDVLDRKHGVAQADVYQMMVYARIYRCPRLMLLYPSRPGEGSSLRHRFGMAGGDERLSIARLDITSPKGVMADLAKIVMGECTEQVA